MNPKNPKTVINDINGSMDKLWRLDESLLLVHSISLELKNIRECKVHTLQVKYRLLLPVHTISYLVSICVAFVRDYECSCGGCHAEVLRVWQYEALQLSHSLLEGLTAQ